MRLKDPKKDQNEDVEIGSEREALENPRDEKTLENDNWGSKRGEKTL